jgi:hypothetical protein
MNVSRLVLGSIIIGLLIVVGLQLREQSADGQATADVLRARAIELVDGGGQVRAQFNVSKEEVIFRLRDAKGAIRVKLGADETGSGLLLLDNRTTPGVQALATRARTSLTLRRGGSRRALRP